MPRTILTFHQVHLTLLRCLMFLSLNHCLHIARSRFLLSTLLIIPHSCHFFFGLCLKCNLLDPALGVLPAVEDGLVRLVLRPLVLLAFQLFVHLLLPSALFLRLLAHQVALPLRDDLVCSLARLVDFLHDLRQRSTVSYSGLGAEVTDRKCLPFPPPF